MIFREVYDINIRKYLEIIGYKYILNGYVYVEDDGETSIYIFKLDNDTDIYSFTKYYNDLPYMRNFGIDFKTEIEFKVFINNYHIKKIRKLKLAKLYE